MSCNNITTLLLSDTFNTWFERTNETIGALNAFEIRGLSANDGTDFKGLKLIDQGSCLYNLNLSTGPFVGFYTTSGENGIYGTGDASSPYNLTLIADGPTMDAAAVTADDQVLVSDTDDGGRFKLAPASAVTTQLIGGNNISVVFQSPNTWTISYVELTFNPGFSISNIENTVYEIGPNGSILNNQQITFSVSSNGQNVEPAVSTITVNNGTQRVSNFNTLTLNGVGSTSDPTVILPFGMHGGSTWFSEGQVITFTASITSDTENTEGVPFGETNVPRTDTIKFGWRFGGCDSTTNHTTASGFFSAETSNLNTMKKNGTNTAPWNAGDPSNDIYQYPTTRRYFDVNVSSNGSYIYFVHSYNSNDTDFGWTPTFYTADGFVLNNWATKLTGTFTTDSGRYYAVWKTNSTFDSGVRTFGVD